MHINAYLFIVSRHLGHIIRALPIYTSRNIAHELHDIFITNLHFVKSFMYILRLLIFYTTVTFRKKLDIQYRAIVLHQHQVVLTHKI